MSHILDNLFKQLMHFIPRGGIGLIIFFSFWIIGAVLQWIIITTSKKFQNDKRYIFRIAGKAIKVSSVLLGALTALGTMGINVSALVAGLGLTGFALGFALRDILSNLLAGALIIVYRPFHRGDQIAVAGVIIQTPHPTSPQQGEGAKKVRLKAGGLNGYWRVAKGRFRK